ncbi:MAG: gamma-butyrobetaine hydroxylase-like domain-containing protein [Pirellulaceae bacterium]|nr:gamma-butyrobetaine hydroxylase-like domain-containing protein [Pirellulaceae bacterium]
MLGMQPMGSYAYSIEFSDGHDTGIYSLELLSEIGTEV